ncbi:MAG: hypothetical protein J7603_18445, partial [Pseudacidovorax sp.]|nr:hypothetical protein [Pseudacidovorax sp.]
DQLDALLLELQHEPLEQVAQRMGVHPRTLQRYMKSADAVLTHIGQAHAPACGTPRSVDADHTADQRPNA